MTGLPCLRRWILIACFTVFSKISVFILANDNGCPETNFIGCVTRIRLQRVPFDTNILNVVFNVTSEAKLRQTCIAYNEALPCFRDRILQCGNEKQKRLLEEVAKMIKFFCSASSSETQQSFLKHAVCIGRILQMPATTDCYTASHPDGKKLDMCRQLCHERKEFLCMMKIWVSEQSLCTMIDTERRCGSEAAEFYQSLQINVFTDSFPILCDYSTTSEIDSSTTSATVRTIASTIGTINSTVATYIEQNYGRSNSSASTSTTAFSKVLKNSSSLISGELEHSQPTPFKPITTYSSVLKSTKLTTTATVTPETSSSQYRRIVEVTALPPPHVVHYIESRTAAVVTTVKSPINRPLISEMDSLILQKQNNRTFTAYYYTTPPTSPRAQTFWRPWYLKGVNYNVETSTDLSTTATTATATTANTVPSTTYSTKVMSLSELFSYPWLKKPKYPQQDLEFTDQTVVDIGTTKIIELTRKENDYAPKLFRWSLWNHSSSTVTTCYRTPIIILTLNFIIRFIVL